MYAEKYIIATDNLGNLQAMPKLPANQEFEVIFLRLENKKKLSKRRPHPDIAGQIKIMGDIINTAAQAEWDLPI
jgi:hypothetical protein